MRSAACTAPRSSSGVGLPPQRLVQRVGGGERVVHGVPVAVIVLHVEARDAQRGRVRDRAADLLLVGAGAQRVEQRGRDDLGIVVEELPAERADVVEPPAPRPALGERVVERLDRAPGERGVVVRVAPLAELLGARRGRGLAHERGQDLARRVLAEVLDRLERLVREVDGVAAVDEHVVGDGREHHRLDVGEPARLRERGLERALGRVGRAGVDEAPVPAPEPVDRHVLRLERADREARRVVARVARDEREAVHERERLVVGSSCGSRLAIATSTVRPAPHPVLR